MLVERELKKVIFPYGDRADRDPIYGNNTAELHPIRQGNARALIDAEEVGWIGTAGDLNRQGTQDAVVIYKGGILPFIQEDGQAWNHVDTVAMEPGVDRRLIGRCDRAALTVARNDRFDAPAMDGPPLLFRQHDVIQNELVVRSPNAVHQQGRLLVVQGDDGIVGPDRDGSETRDGLAREIDRLSGDAENIRLDVPAP